MEKITIKQATQRLNTSRATLYKYLRQCEIQTEKIKNKTYLNIEQVEKIRQVMKQPKTENIEKGQLSKTTQTLKNKIKQQKKELEAVREKNKNLEIQQGEIKIENEQLKTEKIQLETRAEVLEEQNKKIIFQMGVVAEKIGTLEIEKTKLINVTQESKKSGIFNHFFNFWKK